ncbi:MAG: calcium-binding protein, partial [Hyphomicrobium sp.]
IAVGSAASTAITAIGAEFDKFFGIGEGTQVFNNITNQFETTDVIGADFATNVRTLGIGALTSFLTAEIAESLGIKTDTAGFSFFNYTASQGINKLISYAVAKVGEGFNFTEGLSGVLFGDVSTVLSSPVYTAANFAAFAGTYLAKDIVKIENIGGAIGQAIGSAVGTVAGIGLASSALAIGVFGPAAIIVVPFLAAFGGTAIGTWVGNFIGSLFQDNGYAYANLTMWKGQTTFTKSAINTDDWDWGNSVQNMQQAIFGAMKNIVAASGGTTAGHVRVFFEYVNRSAPIIRITDAPPGTNLDILKALNETPTLRTGNGQTYRQRYGGTVYGTYGWFKKASTDGKALVDWAIIRASKVAQFDGDFWVRRAVGTSDAITAADFGRQINWAQNYSAIKSILDQVAGTPITVSRPNFNDAVGTSAEAAWRTARKILVEMAPADRVNIGTYVSTVLSTTTAASATLLLSEIVLAKTFGDIVDAVTANIGGTWTGIAAPNFGLYHSNQQTVESDAAFAARLASTATNLARTALAAAASTGDAFGIAAIRQSTATSSQVLMNQLAVALSFSANVKGLDTADAADDSTLVKTLRSLGLTTSALTSPNFNSVTLDTAPPAVPTDATDPNYAKAVADRAAYDASNTASIQSLIIESLKSSTIAGNPRVVAAVKETAATTIDILLKQLATARGASVLLDDPNTGYLKILSELGVNVNTLGAMDFNSATITATTDPAYQAQIFDEATRIAQQALNTANMSGDQALIAALQTNPALALQIAQTFEGLVKGFVDQMIADGGALISLGNTGFGKINFALIAAATGADRDAKILEAAKSLAFDAVHGARFEGLDLYTSRMLANSTAKTFNELSGDSIVLHDFKGYLSNKDVIDSIIRANIQTTFAAAWAATLLVAEGQKTAGQISAGELQLSTIAVSDFAEGFSSFLSRFDVGYYNGVLSDLSVSIDGAGLHVDVPGPNANADFTVSNTMIGLTRLADGAAGTTTAGTGGNDLWNAADGAGSAFTDGTPETGQSSNDVLLGGTGVDTINAGAGNDYIAGGAGNDVLNGGAGKDVIDGGLGADAMSGSTGDDIYIVDNAADTVVESLNEGIDTVYASVSATLAANVEKLQLSGAAAIDGTGNVLDNTIIGNSANNVLSGDSGNDILVGGAGSDTIRGGAGNDSIIFGSGAGVDVIDSTGALATDTDRLLFDRTISNSSIWFENAGSDLKISILNSGGISDGLLVKDWDTAGMTPIDEFVLANGKTLLRGDVGALISAMAAFSPSAIVQSANGGNIVIPASVQTAIDSSPWKSL